jgi:hypothetical protein
MFDNPPYRTSGRGLLSNIGRGWRRREQFPDFATDYAVFHPDVNRLHGKPERMFL